MEDTSSTTTTELILPTLMDILSSPTTNFVKWKCMVSTLYKSVALYSAAVNLYGLDTLYGLNTSDFADMAIYTKQTRY